MRLHVRELEITMEERVEPTQSFSSSAGISFKIQAKKRVVPKAGEENVGNKDYLLSVEGRELQRYC